MCFDILSNPWTQVIKQIANDEVVVSGQVRGSRHSSRGNQGQPLCEFPFLYSASCMTAIMPQGILCPSRDCAATSPPVAAWFMHMHASMNS